MIVGPFNTIRRLGSGGMGVVELAVDTRTGRQVALKQVPNHADSESQAKLEMEQRGARLLTLFAASSNRVPDVFESGLLDECFYISMEYLDGQNLSQLIPPGGLPIDRACEIARELCLFLEEAHGFETVDNGEHHHSLVHGDLTPRNIRITSRGEVKVFDFGIAKGLRREQTENTWGSYDYMPPERLGDAATGMLDASTDRWAIGVVLHEMLDGRRPFRGKSPIGLKRLIDLGPPSLEAKCPRALCAIATRLLASDPAERYPSASAIRRDIEAFRGGRQTEAERLGWPRQAAHDEETRRTVRDVDTPPTQRTIPPPLPVVTPPPLPVAAPSPPLAAPPRRVSETVTRTPARLTRPKRRVFARTWMLVAAAVMVVMMGVMGNEMAVAREATAVAGQASKRTMAELTDAWQVYDRLSRRSVLGFAAGPLRAALTERTIAASDAVMEEYRSGGVVMSARWSLTRDALASAAAANPSSARLRAATRYSTGHLHRIDGEARQREQQTAAAQQEFAAAITEFRAAAELHRTWPDPFVGLFRTFALGLTDIERAVDALNRAEQLGYRRLPRETAQLAQAYATRARDLVISARSADGSALVEILSRAEAHYRQSVELYESVAEYGGARRAADNARSRLIQVQERLAALSPQWL
jgi:serine/threonine protein kinase